MNTALCAALVNSVLCSLRTKVSSTLACSNSKPAHFSDRGRLFQADRGQRFSAIVDAQGMRASEGLNVSQVDFGSADLSTAEGGACDEPTAAVGKSCWH